MEVFNVIDAKSEAELVARVAAGEERAQEELFERYRRGVTIIINRAINNLTVTEELCQETFRIAIQKILQGKLREPEKLPAFIWSVAHRLVIEHYRKLSAEKRADAEAVEHLVDPAPSQLDQLLQKERAEIVNQVLAKLHSKRDRQVLYRFYIAEEDKKKICEDLKLTSLQFNLVLFRARMHFKSLYEKLAGRI